MFVYVMCYVRAVALDMRGYSESDKPSDLEAYHLNYLAADVKEAIKQLGKSIDYDKSNRINCTRCCIYSNIHEPFV